MTPVFDDTAPPQLRDDWRRKKDALEQIAERCEAINFPPHLVTDIIAMARGALNAPAPGSEHRPS